MRARLDYRWPMGDNTFVNHPPKVEVPADNRPLVAPIYQTVKFAFDDVGETLRALRGEREGFFYSRNTNPTLRQLELTLAQMQGREDCLLVGSGVAAMLAPPEPTSRQSSRPCICASVSSNCRSVGLVLRE